MTSPPSARAQISADIAVLFGTHKGALADVARALPIDYRNLRRILAGQRPVPAWVVERLAMMRTLSVIEPPPGSTAAEDRDQHCGAAIEPHMDDLARRAEAAGWHPAEICAAVLTWTVHRVIDGAGVDAAREMLDDATMICEAEDIDD